MSFSPQFDPAREIPAGIAVHLREVRREFTGAFKAIDGIDLDIAPSEFVAILGPSGCGKSTLLRIIAGLDKAHSGALDTGPRETGHRRRAFVFQDAHLLPWRNALHNVALPLELMGTARAERLIAAADALAQVGLADSVERYPAQLSGGMRMRVSLARALVTNPSLLLLDEPFAALDEITRQHLDEQLHRLWRARRMTVIFVTHSILEATFLAERAVVLTRRPARINLDHRLDLPAERTQELRSEAQFAQQMGVLLEALIGGERNGP
jgi:NitT/TauT family transport system ATP-binding protein